MNSTTSSGSLDRVRGRIQFAALAWNALVAGALALVICLVHLGRALPTQATRGWLLAYGVVFCASLVWLTVFSRRLAARRPSHPGGVLQTLALVEGPLLLLSLLGSLAIYLSDRVNHQLTYFLQPTPSVVLALLLLLTLALQETALRAGVSGRSRPLSLTADASRRWALPASLLLLGLLQGSAYLWTIGNDFTRYWAVADAISAGLGYPVYINQPIYVEAGMAPYSVEYPLFPLLLLLSFALVGHDTLGAHLPGFVANGLLPLLLHGLYRKAGLERPVAFAGAFAVATFPFFRLYTLNAPLPDPIFVALLVATGYAYLHLVGDAETRRRGDSPLPWLAFGLLAGLAALTRAEGLLFVAVLFLGLAPHLRRRRLYLAGAAFAAVVAPFSAVTAFSFGTPWPQNAGAVFGLRHVEENLQWLQETSLSRYADALGLPDSWFLALVGLLALAGIWGTLLMARRRWQPAMLPLAAAVHLALVFAIDPRVSGARLWFDFFRHASLGIPFLALPVLFVVSGPMSRGTRPGAAIARLPSPVGGRLAAATEGIARRRSLAMAVLILTVAAYQLLLLARPSQTYTHRAHQLLTSDVWVTFLDVALNRYPLPRLPFASREGLLVIDPEFEYIHSHLDEVRGFFEPISTIYTGRGRQYQVSSLLVLLFGALFALERGPRPRGVRSGTAGGEVSAPVPPPPSRGGSADSPPAPPEEGAARS